MGCLESGGEEIIWEGGGGDTEKERREEEKEKKRGGALERRSWMGREVLGRGRERNRERRDLVTG